MHKRTGTALAAIAIIVPLIVLTAKAVGINLAMPFLIGALTIECATLAAIVVWWSLPLIRERWLPERSPLALEFDEADPQCVQIRAAHPQRDVQLRVKVQNTGTVDLRNVRTRLDRQPEGHTHWLRVRHDNTPPYALSLAGVDLASRSQRAEYFDVVFCVLGASNVVFQYADEYLLQEQLMSAVPRAVHRIVLEVEGRRTDDHQAVRSQTGIYQVEPLGSGGLVLREIAG